MRSIRTHGRRVARNYDAAAPEDHAKRSAPVGVKVDPADRARLAGAPEGPHFTVNAMPPPDRPIRAGRRVGRLTAASAA